MFKSRKSSHPLLASLAITGIALVSLAVAPAFAGECPADKMKPNVREKVDFKPVGVTDVTLGAINLEKQPANIKDRELRFRKLTIEPGGIVPWHSHDDRPALIYRAAGRDRRICQQLRRPDRAQGRRHPPRSVRHLALVEEPRQGNRHPLCRRRPQGSARPQHVTSPELTSLARSLSDVTHRDPRVAPHARASHPPTVSGGPMADVFAQMKPAWRCTATRRASGCARSSSG